VIFGRKEVKTGAEELFSGETDAIGEFIENNKGKEVINGRRGNPLDSGR
jgi:hypothetical protein